MLNDVCAVIEAKLAAGDFELPVLPEVAQTILLETSREDTDARKLAELIRRDQAMAGHLLRLANSPLYRPRSPIVSLQQAVSRLGMASIRQIAVVISCQTRAFEVKGHEKTVRALFRHALAAAVYAQEIARSRRMNVEDAFLSGLLHDVGRPVLLQAVADHANKMKWTIDNETMDQAISAFHERVGAMLLEKWTLPSRLAEVVRYHHRPNEAGALAPATHLVHLADDFAHLLDGSRSITPDAIRAHISLAPLNLYPEDVERMFAQEGTIKEIVDALG